MLQSAQVGLWCCTSASQLASTSAIAALQTLRARTCPDNFPLAIRCKLNIFFDTMITRLFYSHKSEANLCTQCIGRLPCQAGWCCRWWGGRLLLEAIINTAYSNLFQNKRQGITIVQEPIRIKEYSFEFKKRSKRKSKRVSAKRLK